MPVPVTITDFSAGELSPRLRGRVDSPIYNKGLQTSRNYTSIPFGGVTRRPGTWRIADITSDYDAVTEPLLIDYQSNIHDDVMLIVFQDSSDDITLIPVIFGSTITIGTTRTLANPYPGIVGSNTKWARVEGLGEIYCASKQVLPFTIANSGTADGWTIAFTTYDLPTWDADEYYVPGGLVQDVSINYVAFKTDTDNAANVGMTLSLIHISEPTRPY